MMDNSSADASSEAAKTLEKESMAAFNQLVDDQLKSFDTCSNSMSSMANGLQEMIQGQIHNMVSSSSKAHVYRVFKNKRAGNRIVMRNTSELEGYDVLKFPDSKETTEDFSKALAYSREVSSGYLAGATISPNAPYHSLDKTSNALDGLAEFKGVPEIVEEALKKVNEVKEKG